MTSRGIARVTVFGLVLGGALGVGLLPGRSAITTPAPNSTVRGDIWIYEDRGGQNSFPCGGADSWIEVGGVFTRNKGGDGPWGTTWVSHGYAIGWYNLHSWRKDRFWQWTGCKDGWADLSNFNVFLENLSAISYTSGVTSAYYGEAFGVSANLRDAVTGRGIGGRTVTFDLGGVVASCVTDASGNCATSLTASVTPGSYTLVTSFGGDCCWRGSSVGVGFSVLRRPTTLALTSAPTQVYRQEAATFAARLTDTRNGAGLDGKAVIFEVLSGSTVTKSASATTDGTGAAAVSMLFNDVPAGSYTLRARFAGDAIYVDSAATSPLSVLLRPTAASYVGDTVGYRQETSVLTARFTDVRASSPLAGKPVTFTLGSRTFPATTDSSGVASVTVTHDVDPAGSYTVRAAFAADADFAASSDAKPFDLRKVPTALAYQGDTSGYWDEIVTLRARLTDARSGAALAAKPVSFVVGSATVPATTGPDGVAQASLQLTQPAGSYTVTASFAENADFLGSADAQPFEILRRPTLLTYGGDTSGYWDETGSLSAQLVDVRRGGGLAGQPVTFTLGSFSRTVTTGPDGVATTTVDLSQVPGPYTVQAAFAQTPYYAGSQDARPFEILRRPTSISYTGDRSGYWDEDATLRATLVDIRRNAGLAGQSVVVSLGSFSTTLVTDAQGQVSVTHRLAQVPATYTASAVLPPNPYYVEASDSQPFEILRRPTSLAYEGDLSGYWDEDATLRATLVDVRRNAGLAGHAVTLSLGSFSRTLPTDAAGQVSQVLHLDQVPQAYAVTAAFAGDPYYVESSDTRAFEILRRPTRMTYTGATQGRRGATVTLRAHLHDVRLDAGLAGQPVTFTLGSFSRTLPTDAEGNVSVDVVLDQEPDAYQVSAAFAGDPYYVESAVSVPFNLFWEFIFRDDLRRGIVFLNPSTKEFRFQDAAGNRTPILRDEGMQIIQLPHLETGLPSCVEDPTTGERICLPTAQATAGRPASTQAAAPCVENPATGERVCVPQPPTVTYPPTPPHLPRCIEDPTSGERHCAPGTGDRPTVPADTPCQAAALTDLLPWPDNPFVQRPVRTCADAFAVVIYHSDSLSFAGLFSLSSPLHAAVARTTFGQGIYEVHAASGPPPARCVEDPTTGRRVCASDPVQP